MNARSSQNGRLEACNRRGREIDPFGRVGLLGRIVGTTRSAGVMNQMISCGFRDLACLSVELGTVHRLRTKPLEGRARYVVFKVQRPTERRIIP